jgi:hypothetical protein
VFSSIQELSEKLEAAKYVTDPVTLKVIYLARISHRPFGVGSNGAPGGSFPQAIIRHRFQDRDCLC